MANIRYNNISFLRFLAMLSIFIMHMFAFFAPFDLLLTFPGQIGVQIFAFLSGLLYSTKVITDNKKFFVDNLIKLLIPAAIVAGFAFIATIIVVAATQGLTAQNLVDGLLGYRVYNGDCNLNIGNFWFLIFIYLGYLVTPLLIKAQTNPKYRWIVALICVVDMLIEAFLLSFSLVVTTYVIGFILGKKYFTALVIKSNKPVRAILISVILVAVCSCIYYFVRQNPSEIYILESLAKATYHILEVIIGIGVAVILLILTQRLNTSAFASKVFASVDPITFYFYLAHQPLMVGALSIWGVFPSPILNGILILEISMLLAVIYNKIGQPLQSKILSAYHKKLTKNQPAT